MIDIVHTRTKTNSNKTTWLQQRITLATEVCAFYQGQFLGKVLGHYLQPGPVMGVMLETVPRARLRSAARSLLPAARSSTRVEGSHTPVD